MHSRNHRSPTAFGKIRKGNTFFGGQEKRNEKVLNATGVWTYADTHCRKPLFLVQKFDFVFDSTLLYPTPIFPK